MCYLLGRMNIGVVIDYVWWFMFMFYNGDRNFVWNIVVFFILNEKSYNIYYILDVVERVEENGINLFIVGINFNDMEEIDEILMYFLLIYRYFVNMNMNS